MPLKVGNRLRSAVCSTEVIVVRAPSSDVELTCGGAPMAVQGEDVAAGQTLDPAQAGGSELGKRYANEDLGLELLVTKAGEGSLAADGKLLELKQPKNLPTSD
jgi:hypothetical protein